jgi:hypothetical protein
MFYSHPSSRIRSVVVPLLVHYHYGDVFLPGAGNVVFDTDLGLPPISLKGQATYAGPAPNPIQRPPQIFAMQRAPNSGIGGLVAGQLMTQPLTVPDGGNGSQ